MFFFNISSLKLKKYQYWYQWKLPCITLYQINNKIPRISHLQWRFIGQKEHCMTGRPKMKNTFFKLIKQIFKLILKYLESHTVITVIKPASWYLLAHKEAEFCSSWTLDIFFLRRAEIRQLQYSTWLEIKACNRALFSDWQRREWTLVAFINDKIMFFQYFRCVELKCLMIRV